MAKASTASGEGLLSAGASRAVFWSPERDSNP